MRRAAVAALALPLALAACGGGGSSARVVEATPLASVQSAVKKTSGQTSEHMSMKGTAHVSGQAIGMTGEGDFDAAKKTGSVHAQVIAGALNVPIDEVLDGTVLYMKSPILADALPKGKTWFKLDLERALATKGIDYSALGAQSPSDTFAQMKTMGDVTAVGDETIDGAATTHYRGRIDLSKLPQGDKLKALGNPTYGPYNVWIGKADGLVRRVTYSFASSAGAGRQRMSFQMDFSDFGKDVSVTVPSAGESVDVTDQSIKGLGG
jgi:LppX/LprAFG-like lipoprotein